MNAIELLKTQHQEVKGLFEKLEAAADKAAATRSMLFGRIADELAVHGEIEEKIFYPGVKARDTEDILEHSVEEHMEVKKLIAKLLDMDPNTAEYDALCIELKEDVMHHVAEEETELFPRVQKLLDRERLSEMGEEMEQMAADLKAPGVPMKPREMAAAEANGPKPEI